MDDNRWNKNERSEKEMARSMRKLCEGKFGNMGKDEWNHRIPGTKGFPK